MGVRACLHTRVLCGQLPRPRELHPLMGRSPPRRSRTNGEEGGTNIIFETRDRVVVNHLLPVVEVVNFYNISVKIFDLIKALVHWRRDWEAAEKAKALARRENQLREQASGLRVWGLTLVLLPRTYYTQPHDVHTHCLRTHHLHAHTMYPQMHTHTMYPQMHTTHTLTISVGVGLAPLAYPLAVAHLHTPARAKATSDASRRICMPQCSGVVL